ncbi:MAG: DEAD/DEAH box helicase, partial [Flavobacteriales bacterium]|nr:DEAD/DEAH box helicase [Flavobacteriales bacterium]
MTDFNSLGLSEPIMKALVPLGYETPTPIQAQAIPHVLEGRDVLGVAQTGTGKTAAFSLPMLHRLGKRNMADGRRPIRGLVLSPTRELSAQIGESIRDYTPHMNIRHTVIFGGVKQGKQVAALKRGVDIVVATPGRLLDLIDQGFINLRHLEYFVLDEADTMLDMGFIHDIRKVIKLLPSERQSLFFSATMPQNIQELADTILIDPITVEVERRSSAAETVDQRVYFVRQAEKKHLLVDVLTEPEVSSALVFTRTKYGADKLVRHLRKQGVRAEAIHGNKSQPQREKAMKAFKRGDLGVLVATDIAARGIDVDELSHVVNFEIPNIPETYVHRIGRTGRAGAQGIAISFCNEDDERTYLRDIQRLIRREVPLIVDQAYHLALPEIPLDSGKPSGGGNKGGGRGKGGKRGGQSRHRGGGGGRGGQGGGHGQPRSGSGGGPGGPGGRKRNKRRRPGGNGGGR